AWSRNSGGLADQRVRTGSVNAGGAYSHGYAGFGRSSYGVRSYARPSSGFGRSFAASGGRSFGSSRGFSGGSRGGGGSRR
ncbi:MAG: hypothetical protein ABSG42_09650, partial [Nitrospirota bacterium]